MGGAHDPPSGGPWLPFLLPASSDTSGSTCYSSGDAEQPTLIPGTLLASLQQFYPLSSLSPTPVTLALTLIQ